MARPKGAKNKPKEATKPVKRVEAVFQTCGTCLCSSPGVGMFKARVQCRLMPDKVMKEPQEWCRQWEAQDTLDLFVEAGATPDPEKEQMPHPNDVPLPPRPNEAETG